jgi:hypothetical protein
VFSATFCYVFAGSQTSHKNHITLDTMELYETSKNVHSTQGHVFLPDLISHKHLICRY